MHKRLPLLRAYISLTRIDHWSKQIFVLPGIVIALAIAPVDLTHAWLRIPLSLLVVSLLASANYVINEWLDAEFDRHHPIKCQRASVRLKLNPVIVLTEYVVLAASGMALSALFSKVFVIAAACLLISGVIYNVQPIRTKDKPYIDVLSEAINNPLRLVLGWTSIAGTTIPPISLLLAYWLGGAFLMAVKRYSEYNFIVAQSKEDTAALYRASFFHYNSNKLMLFSFCCALLSAMFGAIFLVKYRAEYLLASPLVAALFTYYLSLGLDTHSVARTPEKLHHDLRLVALLSFLLMAFGILTFVDIPFIHSVVKSDLGWIFE